MKLFNQVLLIFCTVCLIGCNSSDDDSLAQIEKPVETVLLGVEIEGGNLSFGEIVQNNELSKKVTISNSGNSILEVTSISVPEGFTTNWSSGSISAGSSQEITVVFKPTSIAEFQGEFRIDSNAGSGMYKTTCIGNGISEIYEGDIIFTTETQIEEFVKKGYTSISGELCIGVCSGGPAFRTADITSIGALSSVESVETLKISFCQELTDLDGIQQINVSKQLSISNCSSLTNVDELLGFTSIPSVSIFSNESLQNIDGLQNLETVNSIGIIYNDQLKNIDGLMKITEVLSLRIYENGLLENINGLENIKTIQNELWLRGTDKIQNLDALENLEFVGERLVVGNFPQITSLYGLRNVANFDGVLDIRHNRLLNDYCDVPVLFQSTRPRFLTYNRYNPSANQVITGACQKDVPLNVYELSVVIEGQKELDYFLSLGYDTIEGDFIIRPGVNRTEAESITSLESLGLKEVLGRFELHDLDITSLDGLESLEILSGDLTITDNVNLSDFCAITNLFNNSENVNNYTVSGNLLNPTEQNLIDNNCN